jgi:hypothetical protein
MKDFYEKYSDKGLVIIGITSRSSATNATLTTCGRR